MGEIGEEWPRPLFPPVHAFDLHGEGDAHTALDFRPEDRRFAVFSLAVGPDGRDVMGGANDGCVYVYDREAQRRVERVRKRGENGGKRAKRGKTGKTGKGGGKTGKNVQTSPNQ
uniref:DDB1- and CUL4-associated factor 11 n=1 Tax=Lonchura striata TaxID=40157 RepID=UPI000B4D8C2F|nr:DDB1- and CUL4-associated factor 11-like [Lonchura striata domestica]